MSQSFTVFVVDDDPLVLDVIRSILEPDYQLQTFACAEDCLAQLASVKPDFFMLDISLPGIDSWSDELAVYATVSATFVFPPGSLGS